MQDSADICVRILGCGSSGGVPRLGGEWGDCDPFEPKNTRTRCSILVTRETDQGRTQVLIDTSPDMRQQLLAADVRTLDGVLYTHPHADHVHGIDDLRAISFNGDQRLDVWMDASTTAAITHRFGYIFKTPEGSPYPPICVQRLIEGPVTITGAGGPITFEPLRVEHGNISALGFRFADIAYIPDVSLIPEDVWPQLSGLDCWIVDALRYKPHPSHSHVAQTLGWIDRAAPKIAVLTNMHVDLDYQTLGQELMAGVTPAFDGMVLRFRA
ncbi:MBL fold metallo-hydrolase [Ketogulonicigenium vulgare]|uniref:Lipoyltransferase, putative n=1 Tax=Ketogulonicigenium vulgare (strain WSH-001) TaxID=759362 RepID=F9Y4S9_KETVW|nr:MBL fold metallo-hydrolase [Ketogulonicigenium vulgare]ADO43536.1 beta-lactamase domain protein [Ketogulonicigenium vulgare Y25]AEM41813.1 Lipoyltransferase, putative [Ketogulonicigenium vulgare WSH-001]ALJ81920.1 phosphoribosyl 1,2-cyclic phosphodiesterase [Ketogulonicigenium vulgare]ANW34567.1 phosphoribosyl 1,2-cyclic phosphodiesterase [Ketogulonicigenium vulgare]AOZ55571.1 beta-lactamase domain protein [Ketogulonicigenium vulgare]